MWQGRTTVPSDITGLAQNSCWFREKRFVTGGKRTSSYSTVTKTLLGPDSLVPYAKSGAVYYCSTPERYAHGNPVGRGL